MILIPLTDDVFRNPEMPPKCDADSADLFWDPDPYARALARRLCMACPLGPYGREGNLCRDYYESHPEIVGGLWGGRYYP